MSAPEPRANALLLGQVGQRGALRQRAHHVAGRHLQDRRHVLEHRRVGGVRAGGGAGVVMMPAAVGLAGGDVLGDLVERVGAGDGARSACGGRRAGAGLLQALLDGAHEVGMGDALGRRHLVERLAALLRGAQVVGAHAEQLGHGRHGLLPVERAAAGGLAGVDGGGCAGRVHVGDHRGFLLGRGHGIAAPVASAGTGRRTRTERCEFP